MRFVVAAIGLSGVSYSAYVLNVIAPRYKDQPKKQERIVQYAIAILVIDLALGLTIEALAS